MSEQSQQRAGHPSRNRRRFLQVATAAGLVSLAGCTLSIDDTGISWGEDEAETGDSGTVDDTAPSDPDPEATAKRYEIDDFEVTSHNGDLEIYGSIKMRGVYDASEYINPRGRSSWEVLHLDETNYLTVEEGTTQEIIVTDSIIEFPPEVVENLDGREPFVIVRVALAARRETENDVFLGWDSARVFLDELDGRREGREVTMQFTAEGNDVRLSYVVTPIYD